MSGTNTVDPNTGNVTYEGDLEVTPSNHSGMPSRTDAYLPGDERGHVNASSLNGSNKPDNVVAQAKDVNRHDYRAVERGETEALKNGASVHSSKTAFVDGKPGDRPSAFMVNDTITYADGHVEQVHNSFTNASHADQEAWNNTSASLPGTFDAPNPGDALRASMTPEEYAELMEATDKELPGIQEDYQPTTHSTAPASPAANTAAPAAANTAVDTAAADPAAGAGTTAADAAVDAADTAAAAADAADSSADTASDDGGSADASADGSADGGADTSGGDGGCGADPD